MRKKSLLLNNIALTSVDDESILSLTKELVISFNSSEMISGKHVLHNLNQKNQKKSNVILWETSPNPLDYFEHWYKYFQHIKKIQFLCGENIQGLHNMQMSSEVERKMYVLNCLLTDLNLLAFK